MSIEQPTDRNEDNFKMVDGVEYERVPSGYTVRQFYSHETEEMGPGPGWDRFASSPDWVAEKYGIEWTSRFTPNDLPDTPYYIWRRVTEE